jgi:hypothetical protein
MEVTEREDIVEKLKERVSNETHQGGLVLLKVFTHHIGRTNAVYQFRRHEAFDQVHRGKRHEEIYDGTEPIDRRSSSPARRRSVFPYHPEGDIS